jgi:hypothetical protein
MRWLKQIPRPITPEIERFCNRVSGKPLFFAFWNGGQKSWLQEMELARLSFVYVLQASAELFEPDQHNFAPAVLLATERSESVNPRWMARAGDEIWARIRSGHMPNVAPLLEDEHAFFDLMLPREQTGGVAFRMWVEPVSARHLPGFCVPENRVLPALKHGGTWSLIPAALYGVQPD